MHMRIRNTAEMELQSQMFSFLYDSLILECLGRWTKNNWKTLYCIQKNGLLQTNYDLKEKSYIEDNFLKFCLQSLKISAVQRFTWKITLLDVQASPVSSF